MNSSELGFRYAIVPKEGFLQDLMNKGFKFIANPRVAYGLADIAVVDLIDGMITVDKKGRNVISDVVELNTNYLDIPLDKLVQIP